jgi:hypothetical protein
MGNRGVLKAYSLVLMLALLSVPLMGLATAEDDAQWPMSHFDQGNTNRCPYDAAGNDEEFLWSYDFGDRIGKPVIGSDGTLYVTTCNDLFAISSNGNEKWKFPGSSDFMEYSEEPLPAAIGDDGCIFFVTGSQHSFDFYPNGSLYAVWPNGTLRWSDHLDAPALTAPRIDRQGNVLIVTAQWIDAYNLRFSELRCYDEDGGIEWSFSPPSANGSIFSEPASSSNGTVFITTYMNENVTIWAIDSDGEELWNRSIPSSMTNQNSGAFSDLGVSVDGDGSIYLTIGNMLRALDRDGQERWNYSGINGYNGIAIGEDHLFVVHGAYMDILRKDGEWVATYFAWGNILNTPTVVQGDNVILTTWFRGVQMVNATGVNIWNYPLYDAAANEVVVDDQGRFYIIVNDGASSPSIMAIGERGLHTDILAWDIVWGLSILFSSVMLVLLTYSIRSKSDVNGTEKETRKPKENPKLGNIVRIIGCLLMLLGLLLGMWALYGPNLNNYGLIEVFVQTGLPVAVLLAGAYILIIISCAFHAKWGIAQFVVMALITVVMLLSDPLQTVQGAPNDGWVPQLGFVMAWVGTGMVLLSGRYYAPGFEVEEPVVPT